MKILLVTFYDPWAKGCQILSSEIKAAGSECVFLNIREQAGEEVSCWNQEGDLYVTLNGGRMFRTVDVIIEHDLDLAVEFVYKTDPDIVGISTRSFAMAHAQALSGRLGKYTIIAGGWGPTLEPEKAYKWADWVCFGEGDKAVMDIVKGVPLDSIPNLHNATHPLTRISPALSSVDLEALPLPDSHGLDKWQVENGEIQQINPNRRPVILISRGCPMTCSYCMSGQYRRLYRKYTNQRFPKHRIRSVDSIIREIKLYSDCSFVQFADEIFPWQKSWVDEFCERYPLEIRGGFFAHVRPEIHKQDQIERLIKAGMTESAVGLQSASHRILREVYHRALKPEQAMSLAETLTQNGITYPYEVLLNNPYEPEQDIIQTLKWLWDAPYQSTTVFNLVPFPNSPLGKRIEQEQPPETDKTLQVWYGWLCSLAALGPWQRRATKIVHALRLFRRHPSWLIKTYTWLYHWRNG